MAESARDVARPARIVKRNKLNERRWLLKSVKSRNDIDYISFLNQLMNYQIMKYIKTFISLNCYEDDIQEKDVEELNNINDINLC